MDDTPTPLNNSSINTSGSTQPPLPADPLFPEEETHADPSDASTDLNKLNNPTLTMNEAVPQNPRTTIAPLPPLARTNPVQKPLIHTPDELAKSISAKLQSQASSLGMGNKNNTAQTTPSAAPKKESGVQQVRTFRSDVANVVEHNNISAIDIVAAEENRRGEQAPITPEKKRASPLSYILILGTLIFLLGGGGLIGYILVQQQKAAPVQIPKSSAPVVFAEKTTPINVIQADRNSVLGELMKAREKANPPLGTLEQFKIFQGNGKGAELTTEDFFEAIEARADSSFVRSLKPNMMIGLHSSDELVPFVVFKTNSYEQAFSGMLKWEANITDELSPFLPRKGIARGDTFTDTVIRNKDARILRDAAGNIAYIYSFPDRETLVITTREQTLTEIATRLSNTRSIKK